jgi:hypothetical protein
MKAYKEDKLFDKSLLAFNKDLLAKLLDVIVKSNQFLNIAFSD